MQISENKLILLAISGVIYLTFLGLSNNQIKIVNLILNNLFFMLIVYIILYLIGLISYSFFGKTSLGIGDIKLASISTIWLGNELIFISLFISFFLSAIYCLYGKLFKKLKPLQQYPFGPFLSIGIFWAWIIDKI
tara:strand:+ start:205 stop:609 length:405 start_codon:yes stop_codon:yes gene_type:complete